MISIRMHVRAGESGALQPPGGGRVGVVGGEQGRRRRGLPLHPHGQQHPPLLRRLPGRQGPRRRARRHHPRALGVVQGREPELEDPALGPRGALSQSPAITGVEPTRTKLDTITM